MVLILEIEIIAVGGYFQSHFVISWQIYVEQKLDKLNNGQLFFSRIKTFDQN